MFRKGLCVATLVVTAPVHSIVQKAGPIQYLVNNAGYSFMGALEETNVAEARQQFETNFFGVLRVTNAILPGMRQQGHGRIVNISSVLGFLPAPYWGIYAASKHAVEGYTETLDHEIRRFGVRAVLVEPTYTRTKLSGLWISMHPHMREVMAEARLHERPGGRIERLPGRA
jgi:short-subunit dehydrogenase